MPNTAQFVDPVPTEDTARQDRLFAVLPDSVWRRIEASLQPVLIPLGEAL